MSKFAVILFFGFLSKNGKNTKEQKGQNEKDTTDRPGEPTESKTQPKIEKQPPNREPGD